jgi:L-lysine 6-transaminase
MFTNIKFHPATDGGHSHSLIRPAEVLQSLSKHILVDGFEMVVDLAKSHGSRIYDSLNDKWYLDFFTFFASNPVGINHPKIANEDFKERVFHAAVNKIANSDLYTTEMAEFVDTFARVAIPDYLPHAFFVEGGALGNENAMKAAFDWKVQKNFQKGYKDERGFLVAHFKHAFHGRTGYTMSLTNTDPIKVKWFPKFNEWPRITNPVVKFPLTPEHIAEVEVLEAQAINELKQAFLAHPDHISSIIIEPIQGEGGDNHFRPEFFQELRRLADENEAMLILDEVQTGVGMTGKMWAHQHLIQPDMISFGKKMQVCGFLCSKRIEEIENNVFHASSRLNSTWGGNIVDMIRAQRYLEIIEEEHLVANAATVGEHLLASLNGLVGEFPALLDNARGRGLFCAIDFKTTALRDAARKRIFEHGVIILPCGDHSLRFRPALNITVEDIDEGIGVIRNVVAELAKG